MEELLKKLQEKLPQHVVKMLPLILSRETMERLGEKDSLEVMRLIQEAVDEINNGSKESMETLIRRRM